MRPAFSETPFLAAGDVTAAAKLTSVSGGGLVPRRTITICVSTLGGGDPPQGGSIGLAASVDTTATLRIQHGQIDF